MNRKRIRQEISNLKELARLYKREFDDPGTLVDDLRFACNVLRWVLDRKVAPAMHCARAVVEVLTDDEGWCPPAFAAFAQRMELENCGNVADN